MSSTSSSTPPLIGIELARFACTLPVLLWHYQHFYYVDGRPSGLVTAAQPGYAWLQPFYLYGYLSVQAFWCLSGFIFFWKYAQPVAHGQVPFGRFAWLRFSRLYPLHLLTLLLVAGLSWRYEALRGASFVYANQDLPHFVLQLFMASDWGGRPEDWSYNGPIWSISVEILVYGLFFGLSRLGLVRPWMVAALVAGSGLVYALKLTPHPIVLCTFFFYLGALTCVARDALLKQTAPRQRLWVGAALGLLALLTPLVASGRLRPMYYVAVLAPVAIIALQHAVRPASSAAQRLILGLGNMTYSSYLWHFPLQLLAALVFVHHPQDLPRQHPAWLAAYLLLTYGLALASYRWIERPAQDWLRHRGLGRRVARPA